MSDIRVLRAFDRHPVAWKNGTGITREVAVFPHAAGFEDFLWRVSIAEIGAAGPFSSFTGVDREITILDGTLELSFPGDETRHLQATQSSGIFAGELAAYGTPIKGPVTDLSVMTRRGRYAAVTERIYSGDAVTLKAGETALILAMQHTALGHLATSFDLERFDAIQCTAVQDDCIINLYTGNALFVRLQ